MSIPGFESDQRQWEAMLPPEEPDECLDGDCDSCLPCLHAIAADQAEALAEMAREERHLEERYGA